VVEDPGRRRTGLSGLVRSLVLDTASLPGRCRFGVGSRGCNADPET
jgi:hypothetical protein